MIIRLYELSYENDIDPYENAHFLASFEGKNYDAFVRTLSALKDNDEEFQISLDDEWYTLDTWVFNFPKNSEYLPSVDVYVL